MSIHALSRRIHRGEDGFALVTAVLLLAIMALLMVVALSAGNASFTNAEHGARWTRTLTVAEAGINRAITQIAESPVRVPTAETGFPCSPNTTTVCQAKGGGEYQVRWEWARRGRIVITSTGYYPTEAAPDFSRRVQVTLAPVPSFQYALFSSEALNIKNSPTVIGDVYATLGVTTDQNTIICGSIVSPSGDVVLGNGTQILTDLAAADDHPECVDKSGMVWAGGSILGGGGGVGQPVITGDAKASAPSSTTTCSALSTDFQIQGALAVNGQATACGRIYDVTTTNPQPGQNPTAPGVKDLPPFEFSAADYPELTNGNGACYYVGSACSPSPANLSSTAVSSFASVSRTGMKGVYVVWQLNPSKYTKIDLSNLVLGGDLTIITNAPIDFGNTSTIATTDPSGWSDLVVIDLYDPPIGTTCVTEGGNNNDCSIYAKNSIVFDSGPDPQDPEDGVAGLLYTTGKMAFKNMGNAAEGALYAGGMDIKNGFDITYNSRVERILGFGRAYAPELWQELAG